MTVGDYIRCRRLTQAGKELSEKNTKVVDIALKYGYESADAFTVAFKKLHGTSPSAARKSVVNLTFYPRLCFTLSIKGVQEISYQLVEKDTFKVIGRRRITAPESGGTWEIACEDGSVDKMMKLEPGKPYLGLCFGFGEDRSNDTMVGIEYSGDDIDGFESYTYPKSKWLIFSDEGKISDGKKISDQILYRMWDRIYSDFLPQSEYKQANLPTIETFVEYKKEINFCKLEIWIPILN
jgi:AraC family transcriptional regulator